MDAFAALTAAVGTLADPDGAAADDEPPAKGRCLSDPKPPLALFETMRWEAGELRRWPRHRARMAASAAALGLPFDPSAAAAALANVIARAPTDRVDGTPPRTLRVRLELREHGVLRVDARPHDDGADRRTMAPPDPTGRDAAPTIAGARSDEALPVVVWSQAAIVADDPARRHKTLDRALYDEASAWAGDAGVADVLFLNEHGRVAEGAISNVFVLGADGRWRTPPVADGALPGVLRAELIERGQAVEARLWPEDVITGSAAIGNALRGLRRVRVVNTGAWRPGSASAGRPAPAPAGGP
jgi:para-aminobenzoate synthetase / 4-amino-4-deoxychorismate lyase